MFLLQVHKIDQTYLSPTIRPSDLAQATILFLTPSPHDECPRGTQDVQFPIFHSCFQQVKCSLHGSFSSRLGQPLDWGEGCLTMDLVLTLSVPLMQP